jgi:hypothetical protein
LHVLDDAQAVREELAPQEGVSQDNLDQKIAGVQDLAEGVQSRVGAKPRTAFGPDACQPVHLLFGIIRFLYIHKKKTISLI